MIKVSITYIQLWELIVASLGAMCSLTTIVWWLLRDFKRRIKREVDADLDKLGDEMKCILYDLQEDVAATSTEVNHMGSFLQNKHQYSRLLISRPRRD